MKWFGFRKRMKRVYQTVIDDFEAIDEDNIHLTSDIEQNEMILKHIFHNCSDVVFRQVQKADKTKWLVV